MPRVCLKQTTRCMDSCALPAVRCRPPARHFMTRCRRCRLVLRRSGRCRWRPGARRPKAHGETVRRPPRRCGVRRTPTDHTLPCSCRNSSWPGPGSGPPSARRRPRRRMRCVPRRSRDNPGCMPSRCLRCTPPSGSMTVRKPQRLAELAKTLNTPLAEAIAEHARGLANHDGDLLDAAADRFADMGAVALAADAAAQAAREHAHTGHRGKEVEVVGQGALAGRPGRSTDTGSRCRGAAAAHQRP